MALGPDRRVSVSPSQFAHEEAGLQDIIRALPDAPPYRMWSNFEFRDTNGRWHEVDALVLTRDGLQLVELKYYSGVLRGDDYRWVRSNGRVEDSPLLLARRKAQYLATRLKDAAKEWLSRRPEFRGLSADHVKRAIREIVPFISPAVFLHHPQFSCHLPHASAKDLYGLDGATPTTNLPGISELLLSDARSSVTSITDATLPELLRAMGIEHRREREAGSWLIEEAPIAEGDDWQEYLASHKYDTTRRATMRVRVVKPDAAPAERKAIEMVAAHEFSLIGRLQHERLMTPTDLVHLDFGPALVYLYEPQRTRLDLWMANHGTGAPLDDALTILRDISEGIAYVHDNGIAHRRLDPQSIYVQHLDGQWRAFISGWVAAGLTSGGTRDSDTPGVTTHQADLLDLDALDKERLTFAAPEANFTGDHDRARADVFSLGALGYYLLTGQSPAATRVLLTERLRRDGGLRIHSALGSTDVTLADTIQRATNPRVSERTVSATEFRAGLAAATASTDESAAAIDPLQAERGALLEGRFEVRERLGQGATAVGLLVHDRQAVSEAAADSPDAQAAAEQSAERVLKVALDEDAEAVLAREAAALSGLTKIPARESRWIVRLIEGPIRVGGRSALLLENAGTHTLNDAIRAAGRIPVNELKPYGEQLLRAVAVMERRGIDHRDIKPANIGVSRLGNNSLQLKLFDFSLAGVSAGQLEVGTQAYSDPYLRTGRRSTYDDAAERFSAALVLFEMATGRRPTYGDGVSDPRATGDAAHITEDMFVPVVGPALAAFFERALHPDVAARFASAEQMRDAWLAIFTQDATTIKPSAADDEAAAAASLATPLASAGFTPRMMSVADHFAVSTVGEFLNIDVRRIAGARVGNTKFPEKLVTAVRKRHNEWSKRFPKNSDTITAVSSLRAHFDIIRQAAEKAQKRSTTLVSFTNGIFGFTGSPLDPFSRDADIATSMQPRVTPGRVAQLWAELFEAILADAQAKDSLRFAEKAAETVIADLGGVATADEASRALANAYERRDDGQAGETYVARALLKIAVMGLRKSALAAETHPKLTMHRRRYRGAYSEGQVCWIAQSSELVDMAMDLGRVADELVELSDADLVPVRVAVRRLGENAGGVSLSAPLRGGSRISELACITAETATCSARGDLYDRNLPLERLLAAALTQLSTREAVSPAMLAEQAASEFGVVCTTAQVVGAVHELQHVAPAWCFDSDTQQFVPTDADATQTQLQTRVTMLALPGEGSGNLERGVVQALHESVTLRGFVAVGVAAAGQPQPRPLGEDAVVAYARQTYGADVYDASAEVLDVMHRVASDKGIPWDLIMAASAVDARAGDRRNFDRFLSGVRTETRSVVDSWVDTKNPPLAVIRNPGLLAHYGMMDVVNRIADQTRRRGRGVWLLLPTLSKYTGAVLDGHPVQLFSQSQYIQARVAHGEEIAGSWHTQN